MTLTYSRLYGRFQLECWGNGLAYALTDLATEMQVYVQGDDARTFEEDRAAIENSSPEMDDAAVMAWLWDQCDYGSAAVQK